MTTLLFRLAFAGIRSRLLASALTIAIAGAAAATIVLALEVRSSGRDPWQQTFDAAHGAHVLVFAHSHADVREIANLPGVTERGAPVPLVTVTLGPRSADRAELAGLRGRSREQARADGRLPAARRGHPSRTKPARARGIEVGATLELTTRRGSVDLPVLGTAVVPSQPRYPRRNPGLAWVTRATLERIEPDRTRWRWTEALRLANPWRPRRLPSGQLQASRRPRGSPALSTSSPGKTSATTHWPMRSQLSSS